MELSIKVNLPNFSHRGSSLDQDSSSPHVNAALPIRIWLAAHLTVVVVPVGEAFQLPCVDPSTVKAGHTDTEWKK